MPLNLKNPRVEKLVAELAAMTGESKTEAIRKAVEERRDRLSFRVARRDREAQLLRFLAEEVWPVVRRAGRRPTRREEDAILGYGPDGA